MRRLSIQAPYLWAVRKRQGRCRLTQWDYERLSRRDDPNRELTLTVLVFGIPQPEA